MGSQSGKAWSPAATHTEKESIAQRLSDNLGDPADMPDGIKEEHEFHLGCVHLVLIIKVLLQIFFTYRAELPPPYIIRMNCSFQPNCGLPDLRIK